MAQPIQMLAVDDRPSPARDYSKQVGNISSYRVEEQHGLILDDILYLLMVNPIIFGERMN